MSRTLLLCGALALTLGAPAAFPAPPATREQALAALEDPVAERRAEAVAWVAEHGHMTDTEQLVQRLRDDSPLVRDHAERGLWQLWSRSGERETDELMARGVAQMQAERYAEAAASFGAAIRRQPGFAEAWNKRATVLYLAGEYRQSLADCEEVLKRNPRHFGALSGLGQIYFALEDYEQALAWWRRALEVNPNMPGVQINILHVRELLREKRGHTI
jgi:tetratricopeptide (TPR) repeat protein